MNAAGTYRRYAAQCVSMSQQGRNPSDTALFLKMATMWPRLAAFAEKSERPDDLSERVKRDPVPYDRGPLELISSLSFDDADRVDPVDLV